MYHYEGCGLPHVYLKNGYKRVKTPYGEGVTIHDLPGLHRAIGKALVLDSGPLVGCEFRFLRQELELSQAALAALVGREEQAVARWEKDKNKKVDPAAERLLRVLYQDTAMGSRKLRPLLERLRVLEAVPPSPKKFVARERNDSWLAQTKDATA